jgi:hypothetical protein
MIRTGTSRTLAAAAVAACLLAVARPAHAGFTVSVFANGSAVGATQPDSITSDGRHVWISYSNGASSTLPPGTDGSSTIVEYSLAGKVLNTFSIGGSVDGLRYNPATGQIWALQNQDSHSQLTTINATTGALAHYLYTSSIPGRGYDDATFVGGKAYLSYTNVANPSRGPIIVQATLGNGTVSTSPVLLHNATGTNTATGQTGSIAPVANDPDSLTHRPDGSLLLGSQNDGALITVKDPGTSSQAVSFVSLISPGGAKLTGIDDTVFARGSGQRLLVADPVTNAIYALQGPFQAGAAYGAISDFNSVDSIDLTTGVSTSITDGLLPANASPHGLLFVSSPVPEPSSLVLSAIGALAGLGYACRLRRKRTSA